MLSTLCRAGGAARRAALSLESCLSPRLHATPAARRSLSGEAEKKPEEDEQRRAAQVLVGRTPCTEPEKEVSPSDVYDMQLLNRLYQLRSKSAKELHDLEMESLQISKDLDDAVEAYRRAIAEAKAAKRKDTLEKMLGFGLLLSMALVVVRG